MVPKKPLSGEPCSMEEYFLYYADFIDPTEPDNPTETELDMRGDMQGSMMGDLGGNLGGEPNPLAMLEGGELAPQGMEGEMGGMSPDMGSNDEPPEGASPDLDNVRNMLLEKAQTKHDNSMQFQNKFRTK
jgi:hypothetical protein